MGPSDMPPLRRAIEVAVVWLWHSFTPAVCSTKQRDPVIAPPQPDAPPPICRGNQLVYHFAAVELGGSIQVSVISTIGRAPPKS